MTIVIPMAGLSNRFILDGFTLPKYMLYVGNKSLFSLSVSSFLPYFKTCKFLLIARNIFDSFRFIKEECQRLGIRNFEIIILDEPTSGQADTVFIGLKRSSISFSERITIFNIDTFCHGFKFPEEMGNWDGYLDVFIGQGENWSYAKTESKTSTKVVETAEKIQISNYCSTGLYNFKSVELFMDAFEEHKTKMNDGGINELYIAPLYNYLIQKNCNVHINIIDKVTVQFCGTPQEYYQYLEMSKFHS
jgi:hypothetical protein